MAVLKSGPETRNTHSHARTDSLEHIHARSCAHLSGIGRVRSRSDFLCVSEFLLIKELFLVSAQRSGSSQHQKKKNTYINDILNATQANVKHVRTQRFADCDYTRRRGGCVVD